MNERIKLLAEQAGFRSDVTVTDGNNKRIDTKTSIALEKFAELIVRECADVAKETRWAVPPSQEQIARGIQQHFGIEA